jgi:hypothetical protein
MTHRHPQIHHLKFPSEICIHSGGTQWKGISGSKVTGKRSKVIVPRDTPLSPNTPALQIPIRHLLSFRRYRAERNLRVNSHYAKVKTPWFHHTTHIILVTSSLQIPIWNLHSFRTYRAEGDFRVKGHWTKLKVPRFHHGTHLCPLIHHSCKYQSKICIHSGDTERNGISGSKSLRHDSIMRHTFVVLLCTTYKRQPRSEASKVAWSHECWDIFQNVEWKKIFTHVFHKRVERLSCFFLGTWSIPQCY